MAEHDLDPELYLQAVHDIDRGASPPDPGLAAPIAALGGRRIVYRNGSAPYAARVLGARGLSAVFDAVYGVDHSGDRPKPESDTVRTVFARHGREPRPGKMLEDSPRNLAAPHAMGMRTVYVAPGPARHDLVAFQA